MWIALLAVLALTIGIALGWWSDRRLRHAVRQLSTGFRAAISGDLSFRLEVPPGGDATGLIGGFNDMVERLQAATADAIGAHEKTSRALARAQLVNDAARLGTWYHDMRTGEHVIDEAYAAMLGETVESFGADQEAFYSRLHPDDFDAFRSLERRHLDREGENFDTEFRLRHRDGSWRWIATYGRVLARDADGRAVAAGGTHRDITDLRVAQAERDAQQRLLSSLSNNIPWVLHRLHVAPDGTWRFGFVGGKAGELFGTPAESLTPRVLAGLMTEASREAAREAIGAALAQGRDLIGFEIEIVRGEGEGGGGRRWVRIDSHLVGVDAGGSTWDGIFIDVTQEVAQRRELEQARRQADAASQAKSAFLSSVGHELRTPMTGILGYASMIERLSGDASIGRMAGTVRASAQRLTALLNDVLDAAQIEAGALTVTLREEAVREIVADACELFGPAARAKGLALAWAVGEGVPQRVACDGMRMRQVLNNLLSNAVKFTERGGIRVQAQVHDGWLRIGVTDTGCGIPPAQQAGLFEHFRQAHDRIAHSHGGTGLGLALSRDFMRRMGGDVTLHSVEGQGTRVDVLLPLVPARSEPVDTPPTGQAAQRSMQAA